MGCMFNCTHTHGCQHSAYNCWKHNDYHQILNKSDQEEKISQINSKNQNWTVKIRIEKVTTKR